MVKELLFTVLTLLIMTGGIVWLHYLCRFLVWFVRTMEAGVKARRGGE